MIEHIYGIDYEVPALPAKSSIGNFGIDQKKQKFYRTEIPAIFDDLEFNNSATPVYTKAQEEFINKELDKFENGSWFYNFGAPTYITGLDYFFLNYWTLEDGTIPDYRDADRQWFYFQDYCEGESYIDGIIRTKKRREGATSQATASLALDAITIKRAFCGIVSKTGQDAKDAFLKMIVPGIRSLPVFLKPRMEDENPKTELIFQEPKSRKRVTEKKRGQLFDASLGLGSRISFRNTELNSFDSGRLTKALVDEGGKFPAEVPVNQYWPIIRQTLKQGGRRVGFALLPSTSNKMTKGGKGFKILWDESNHFENKVTATGLYRYFRAAEHGLVPFIDEYGMSVIGKPTKEQAKWMREYYNADNIQCDLGAAAWLDYQYNLIKDEESKNEFRRMYPRSERDAFDFENNQSLWSKKNLEDQKEYLELNKPKIRSVRFLRKENLEVDWVDDPNGNWKILYLPSDDEKNKNKEEHGKIKPANTHKYSISVDPFRNTIISGKGSKGAAFVMKKEDPLDPENSGMPIAMYYGRPRLKETFHTDMLLAAEFYGADLCYESDIDDYYEFLMRHNKVGYAKETPKSVIDPNRKPKKERQFGVKSADGFAYTMQLDLCTSYIEYRCHKIYFIELIEDLLEFDVEERTLYDLSVAFQVGLAAIATPINKKKQDAKKVQVVKTYNIISG